ncbi:unnamed protein product, partial [Brachionus calyciflorus]
QLKFCVGWRLHSNYEPEYYQSTDEPFENVYDTATESIAEMLKHLDDKEEKNFIDWMKRKKPEELKEILAYNQD